jgi:hypothetical protein
MRVALSKVFPLFLTKEHKMKKIAIIPVICKLIIAGVLAIAISAPAHATVYNFDHQVSGNPNNVFVSAARTQVFVEITENTATAANDVLFKFTNMIPDPDAKIVNIWFDAGNFTDLLSSMSIWDQSGGVLLTIPGDRPTMDIGNTYGASFTVDYSVGRGSGYPANKSSNAINAGEYLVLNATLGLGKSLADVLHAMDVGRDADQSVAQTGLRIAELVHEIWGEPIENDDFGVFIATNVVTGPTGPVIASLLATPAALLDSETSQLAVVANDLESGPLPLSYQWTIVSGGGALNDPTSATPIYTPADVVGTQSVTLHVAVSDGANSTSGTLNLVVTDANAPIPNQPPQISALNAAPMTLLDTGTSQLAVTAADPDNGPGALSYQWTIISGGGVVDNATAANPIFTPADVVGNQSVTLGVAVSDGAASVNGSLTLQVQDANPPPLGAELLAEDFSSGSFAGWTVHDEGTPAPSKWRIISGQLTQQSSISDSGGTADLARLGTYLSYDEGLGWTDYRLKLTALTTTLDDDTWGVMFRVRDANNYYRLTWDMQRKQRRLVKKEGGVFTLLAADSVPYVQNKAYQIEIVAQGAQLEVWIDGVRIFQVTDAKHANGSIAFHNWLQNATFFDDIQVNAIE